MGNPHAVVFVDRVDEATRQTQLEWGRFMERHAAFAHRMNVHFVQVMSPDEVTVLHWERGSGPTLACGTGACAVAVAGAMIGRTGRMLTAHLPGGDLLLEWREDDNHVHMTGPAVEVFTGDWPD
jgi:diaminopimelate epimerase